MTADQTTLALWAGVVASGLYHGLSPGMGWPLAVAAGLMARRRAAMFAALGPLAAGHFAAVGLALAPFAVATALVAWRREIQIAAALAVVGFGLWRLADRRHPRLLARVPPAKLALWSFLMALAHGAGLMLVPIFMGLCATPTDATGPLAAAQATAGAALGITALHTAAMVAAGGAAAWLVHDRLGLAAIRRGWLNLDRVWALGLILAGAAGLWAAL